MPDEPRGGHESIETVARLRLHAPEAKSARFSLDVIEGPDAGLRCEIDGSLPAPLLAGQGPACALRLSDREVSRRHAAFEVAGLRLRIRDLGSTNGTFVDGIAVIEALLQGDEVIRVGRTALKVERAEDRPIANDARDAFGKLVGSSSAMRRLYPYCDKLASSDVPVIVEGETGTGKEVLAESIHEQGTRSSGPFVVFDCTAVPPSLLESELFGHEKGAFTGAVSARKGVFELAHGGTLLIDEIGDLELSLQPKLLRAIERSEVRRLGADRPIRVDTRVIAATRRDLDKAVQAGRFRDDLFHRLAVGRIELPPLRHRQGDVPILARHFRKQMAYQRRIPDQVLLAWEEYAWPGNVRELRNAVARYLALGEPGAQAQRDPEVLPTAPPAHDDLVERILAAALPLTTARQRLVEEFEHRYVERVLAAHGGNVARAAAASGVARRYFQILKARQGR